VNFSELPPSKQWAALKYRGEKFAEVWFKPEGEPFVVAFQIPRASFQLPDIGQQLTLENLLKAVGIAPEEIESWRQDDVSYSGAHGSNPLFHAALNPPSLQVGYLGLYVHVKPPVEITPTKWHDLETRWRAILTSEATMETLRISMESLLAEIESMAKKPLTMEEKTYAPRADVALWNKAKSRVHNAVPKMKDYIHRSVWAMGAPERKRLEELYNDCIRPQIPFPHVDEIMKQLEELRKDRQVLSAHGKTIYQECKGISAELQTAMRTLHHNAVSAQKKKEAASAKGRRF
jgi:hypothetical protein